MWSLRQTLLTLSQLPLAIDSSFASPEQIEVVQTLFPNGHLPDDFDPREGIRRLFPTGQTSTMSSLKSYILSQDGTVSTGDLVAQLRVRADGSGNWLLKGLITSGSDQARVGAGFVFAFSADPDAHGFVATGDIDNQGVAFVTAGADSWIAQNWPQIFTGQVYLYISEATGTKELPPIVDAATDHGFSGLTTLQGPKPGDRLSDDRVTWGPLLTPPNDLLWGI